MLLSIISFILILGLLVLVHELGHFWMAIRNGVKVEEFGIGFPPRIFGVKKGDVLYTLNWIPLGGFVKIKGESGEFQEEQDSFANKKIWQRFVILVAGVTMNVLLAVFLFMIGFIVGFPDIVDENLPASAVVRDQDLLIVQVADQSPALEAGLQLGDRVLRIHDTEVATVGEFQSLLRDKEEQVVSMTIQRNGDVQDIIVTPHFLEETGQAGIGVGLVQVGIVSYPIHIAVVKGVTYTADLTGKILDAFYHLFKDMLVKQQVNVDVSGPVGIAVLTGKVTQLGILYLLQFTALLSLNLAIINLLPIPALDGGRILFLLIEKVRGKPMNQRVEGLIHQIGFLLLILLVIIITYRDISIHGAKILNAIVQSF